MTWDQQTRIAVGRAASQNLESVEDVVQTLSGTGQALQGLDVGSTINPVRAFNDLYLKITTDVLKHLNDGTYHDPEFMEALDIEFGRLYFEALHSWSEDRIVPVAWAKLFLMEHDGERHSPFEGALLGVNAPSTVT